MSTEYQYDNESGSFRPVEKKKKNDSDLSGWIWIAIMFAIWWPIGLIMLISKLSDSPRKNYTAASSAQRAQTVRPAAQTQSAPRTQRADAKVVNATKKVTRTPNASAGTARTLMIVGAVVAAIFGMGLLSTIGDAAAAGWASYYLEDILSTGGFFAGGVVTLIAGWRMKKRTNRIARYLAVIGSRDYISVEELVMVVGKRRKTVERDLEFMVEKNTLGTGAYYDAGRGLFFRSADAAQRYAAEKAEKAEKENLTPKEAQEGYAGALRAIRYANDRIADAKLSAQIDHLELVAGKIFREVEQHPEKQQQASTFFNYYLPTTLKILNTYAEFESAGIEGSNLQQAKERIEATMDTLIKGFDKQLDDLYRNEAMDIDSDIRVMETMLKRDISSVEEDFGLGGAAVQRAPDEE